MGQSFQVHGVPNTVYSIITSSHLHMNALFTFIRARAHSKYHTGNYMSKIAFMYHADSESVNVNTTSSSSSSSSSSSVHVLIVAGDAAHGFASITVNDVQLRAHDNTKHTFASSSQCAFSIQRRGSHDVQIHTPSFSFIIKNAERFLNIAESAYEPTSTCDSDDVDSGSTHTTSSSSSSSSISGLLGWTVSSSSQKLPGDVTDYQIDDSTDMFSTHFVNNRYLH